MYHYLCGTQSTPRESRKKIKYKLSGVEGLLCKRQCDMTLYAPPHHNLVERNT